MPKEVRAIGFLTFLCLLIVAEIACANLAWETVGEIESSFLFFLTCLNIVPISIFFLKKMKFAKVAVGLASLLAVFIIPHQLQLLYRWTLLQQEASSIIKYANQYKNRTGGYPRNLAAYSYLYPNLKPHITYSAFKSPKYHQAANGDYVADKIATIPDFGISLYIESPDTPHQYQASGGYKETIDDWWYYPD